MPDLDMSPYGAFVWTAYGISAVTLLGLIAVVVQRARSSARRLASLEPSG